MVKKRLKWNTHLSILMSLFVPLMTFLFGGTQSQITNANVQLASAPRVNVPYLKNVPFTPAVFWFGKVDPTSNYSDVRIEYNDDVLAIYVHIIDRRLFYDPTHTVSNINQWDAVSIYLNLEGNAGTSPGNQSYRFDTELYNDLQATYRGNGTSWIINNSISINSHTEYRGISGPNSNVDSEGWVAYFYIPFSTLGMTGPPVQGTQWGLGVINHDRDDAAGSIRQDNRWPETLDQNTPATWGQLSFGWPNFTPSNSISTNTIMIRQGLNGATVVDGAVGGHTICGNDGADKWTKWGSLNYAGYPQLNIQNQWDISDWPCFSKFYITFSLNNIPSGQTINSANLTLSLFGTAGGGQWGPPPDSYIEVLTIDKDWDEALLTWNNAPLAAENISGTWVPPVPGDYSWDVSRALIQAYQSGKPLRLAVYSIDGDRHTGKYFYTSNSNDWNGEVRPTLKIFLGQGCGNSCYSTHIPIIIRR